MELLIIKMENYDSDFKFNSMEGEDGDEEVLEEGVRRYWNHRRIAKK